MQKLYSGQICAQIENWWLTDIFCSIFYFLIEVLLAKRKPLISPVLHDSEEVVSHKSYHNIDAIPSAQLLQHSPGKTSNESK